MRFGFDLVSSDANLGNMDLLDTHLDFLGTNIPSKAFVPQQYIKTCIQRVLRTSSSSQNILRDVFKTSSRRVGRRKIATLKTF